MFKQRFKDTGRPHKEADKREISTAMSGKRNAKTTIIESETI